MPGVDPHYTGNLLAIELGKPSYQVGETVRVSCRVRVTRSAMGARYTTWYSEVRAYDVAGAPRRITQARATHIAPPERPDEETYDVSLNLGPQIERGLRVRLELWTGTRRPPAPAPPLLPRPPRPVPPPRLPRPPRPPGELPPPPAPIPI